MPAVDFRHDKLSPGKVPDHKGTKTQIRKVFFFDTILDLSSCLGVLVVAFFNFTTGVKPNNSATHKIGA
jgi:hypothetical protein